MFQTSFLYILPEKLKNYGFLIFSGGIEREHWPEMDYIWERFKIEDLKLHKKCQTQAPRSVLKRGP